MRSMNKKEYNKKYYKEHRDKILAYGKQWYEQNKDKNRDKKKEYDKQYYKEHRNERSAYKKQYREQNKDKFKQQIRAWRENHIEQYREIMRKVKTKRERSLGFVPLNKPFEGSEAHHICPTFVIYIPKDMHRSIYHNVWTGKNMEEINKLAWEELYKQRATDTFQCI